MGFLSTVNAVVIFWAVMVVSKGMDREPRTKHYRRVSTISEYSREQRPQSNPQSPSSGREYDRRVYTSSSGRVYTSSSSSSSSSSREHRPQSSPQSPSSGREYDRRVYTSSSRRVYDGRIYTADHLEHGEVVSRDQGELLTQGLNLYEACDQGDLAEVRRLLGPSCTDVNKWMGPDRQMTPLLAAAGKNHTQVAMLLLSCDANPNESTAWYPYPMMHAAEHGALGVVHVLLGAQAQINLQSYGGTGRGWTPIMKASKLGYVNIVKALISAEANLKLKREDCYDALMFASEYGHLDIVKELISAGAPLGQYCWSRGSGMTPLLCASRSGHLDIMNELISAGASVDRQERQGYTALMIASRDGNLEVVKVLISAGADVDQRQVQHYDNNSPYYTALMYSVEFGHLDVITALAESGANMNTPNRNGETALHIAVKKNQTEAVKTLLKHGADTKITTRTGETAEDHAKSYGVTDDILKLIQQYTVCSNLYQ